MTIARRRVRTAVLTAPSDGLVRRGAAVLADALRIATLPGSRTGRLLVVRSLAVGDIHPEASPAGLALSIDRQVLRLDAAAVAWHDSGAGRAPAVFFEDDVEPCVALALRLARHEPVTAWFWPLAVAGWRPDKPRDEAFRMLLSSALETRAGPGGLLRLLDELCEAGALDPLLGALRSQDGSALLRSFGWAVPAERAPEPSEVDAPEDPGEGRSRRDPAALRAVLRGKPLPSRWMVVLERWIGRWSPADERAVWLAGMALAAGQPARLLDPKIATRAHRVAIGVAGRARSAWNDDRARGAPAASPPPPSPASAAGAEFHRDGAVTAHVPAFDGGRSGATSDPASPGAETTGVADLHSPPGPRGDLASPRAETAGADAPHPASRPESRPHTAFAQGIDDGPIPAVRSAFDGPRRAIGFADGAAPSDNAGLFFAIPIMARLGMAPFLGAHPDVVDLDLPRRLLDRLGERLGISAGDPVRAAAGPVAPAGSPASAPNAVTSLVRAAAGPIAPAGDDDVDSLGFAAPARWFPEIARRDPLIARPSAGVPGRRLLFDRSGVLPVALWRGRPPEAVRALARGSTVRRGRAAAVGRDSDVLIASWLAAIRRWSRRYAHMGVGELVRRPGRVAATRTHIDLVFTSRQADVRIRTAGLDLDPGWVPWLGRVVRFHYRDG